MGELIEHIFILVCEKGHELAAEYSPPSLETRPFCHICGAPTLSECPRSACAKPIRKYQKGGGFFWRDVPVPDFCADCGAPFPWASEANERAPEKPIENFSG
ncbi:MAG: DUF2321 domain-containing protein [Terriglobia bacterium]